MSDTTTTEGSQLRPGIHSQFSVLLGMHRPRLCSMLTVLDNNQRRLVSSPKSDWERDPVKIPEESLREQPVDVDVEGTGTPSRSRSVGEGAGTGNVGLYIQIQ